jgi:UDP-N-acetylglucosamine--N-acetylmuramyl-(pentapeptide) pyrophosphoryl-undecaprenol N-acetylglucosamine transferase
VTARPTIALTAGGTGGHVFPALALAEELRRRGHTVAFITDSRGGGFSEQAGLTVHKIRAGRLGPGLLGKARGAAELAIGYFQAKDLLARIAPRAVVGFGSYASVPTMLAATRLGLPTLVHEQNAVLGRANRLVARKVGRIATSFAQVSHLRPGDRGKLVRTGNPIRPAIAALRSEPYPLPPSAPDRLRVLVLGGSQGATVFSRIVPAALGQLPSEMRKRFAITQQCRAADLESARAAYADLAMDVELAPFFADVPERLARTHLMVSRSGASTVAELTAAGRPSVLVPYPHATDDHQTVNARSLAEAAAAWLIPDDAHAVSALATRLQAVTMQPALLVKAAEAARALGAPDAASRLADEVEAIAGLRAGTGLRRTEGAPGPQAGTGATGRLPTRSEAAA